MVSHASPALNLLREIHLDVVGTSRYILGIGRLYFVVGFEKVLPPLRFLKSLLLLLGKSWAVYIPQMMGGPAGSKIMLAGFFHCLSHWAQSSMVSHASPALNLLRTIRQGHDARLLGLSLCNESMQRRGIHLDVVGTSRYILGIGRLCFVVGFEKLREAAQSDDWVEMLVLYYWRSIDEDFKVAGVINKLCEEVTATNEEISYFFLELDVVPGWVVVTQKTSEFLKETQEKDDERLPQLEALERETEAKAREKFIFIEKSKGDQPF
ncbi:hypothetical protein Tco_1213823 [Tanacetum coccineum]